VDTCGVLYLHGLPGLLGGVAALATVDGIGAGAQLSGLAVTVLAAGAGGLLVGKLLSLFGRRAVPYTDAEEFEVEEAEADREEAAEAPEPA
jgi:ammonium transporter Rh